MNRYDRWYCRPDRWAKRLKDAVVPWVLGSTDERAEFTDAKVSPAEGAFRFRAVRVPCGANG